MLKTTSNGFDITVFISLNIFVGILKVLAFNTFNFDISCSISAADVGSEKNPLRGRGLRNWLDVASVSGIESAISLISDISKIFIEDSRNCFCICNFNNYYYDFILYLVSNFVWICTL